MQKRIFRCFDSALPCIVVCSAADLVQIGKYIYVFCSFFFFFPSSLYVVSKPSGALLLDPQCISQCSLPEGTRQLALPWWALCMLKMLMGARNQV